MSTNIPFNANPLASNQNTYIPFDITRPASARKVLVLNGAPQVVTLPDPVNLLMVVSSGPFTLFDAEEIVVVDGWELGAFQGAEELYYNLVVGPSIVLRSDASYPVEIVLNRQTIWSALSNMGAYISS